MPEALIIPKPKRASVQKEETPEDRDIPIQRSKALGHIPPELMTPDMRREIESFLSHEIEQADMERSDFISKLARWERAYKAPMPDGPKHFPIFNSSNITLPVIKEAVNTLAAQLVQATDTARPRWIFKELAKEWEPFVDGIETFLDIASDRDMNLSPVHADWVVDIAKLGTGILEMPWEVDVRRIYKYNERGDRAYPSEVVFQDGPAPRHIPLAKFWIRFHERELQKARWCGTEIEFNEVELIEKAMKGRFHSIKSVINEEPTDAEKNKVQKESEDIEETNPLESNYTVHKIWLSWDIDGDGRFEEILVYFHRKTGKIIGEFFHPYWHGRRPFVKEGYFPNPDRFYDEGLCEMLEQIQMAISAMENRRADNSALANLKMIIKKKTVRSLQPGDPLYSGKIIETVDPFTDIREFQMSEIYPSTIQEQVMLQQRAERVAGTNEGIAGAAMPVSRTTASAQIALLQEQAKRIDLTVRNIRRGQQKLGRFAIDLYSQYGTNGKAVAWMGVRGKEVEAVFRLPRRALELGVSLHAQTPTSMQNRQVRRENKLAMFNLLLQLHERIFEIAQAFAPESLPLVAAGAIKASQKFMVDVLETFEEPDPEGVLASLTVLEKVLPQMEDFGGLDAFSRGVEASEILDRISGLENLVREAEASAEGRGGVSNERGNGERTSSPEGVSGGIDPSILFGGRPSGSGSAGGPQGPLGPPGAAG